MSDDNAFRFLHPGRLVDGDLELILVEKGSADSSRGYVPSYEFAMRSVSQNTNIGHISLRIGNDENLENTQDISVTMLRRRTGGIDTPQEAANSSCLSHAAMRLIRSGLRVIPIIWLQGERAKLWELGLLKR